MLHGRKTGTRNRKTLACAPLVDITSEVLTNDTRRIGISSAGFCLTALPHVETTQTTSHDAKRDTRSLCWSNVSVAGTAPWRRSPREARLHARGRRGQECTLYRVGAQNSRMAATSPGIVRWASNCANSVRGPCGGAPRTGRPSALVQCARIGISHRCASPRAGGSFCQNFGLSWMAA